MRRDIDAAIGVESEPEEEHTLDEQAVMFGVSISWLAAIFGKSPRTVNHRLAECPVLRMRGKVKLYSVRQAAEYLVDPKVDAEAFIKKLRPQDLPPYLQKDFWAGQRSRQAFELQAGDLWRTSDVLDVLGEAFKRLRSQLQLFPEQLERQSGLANEQRVTLTRLTDELQKQMHQALVQMPRDRKTVSNRGHVLKDMDLLESEDSGG